MQLNEMIPVVTHEICYKQIMLKQERLKELLSYDPDTGVWIWLVGRGGELAGKIVTTKNMAGYIQVMIDRKNYSGHRLAWFYVMGEWPSRMIDHKNTIRSDNRWANLRLATMSQNYANSTAKITNTTGFKGVSKAKGGKKFKAQITKDRKVYCLGVFDTAEEAHGAYVRAANRLYGEFARAG